MSLLYPNLLLMVRESGLWQYEVAHRAGMREQRLSQLIHGSPATTDERFKLAVALDEPEWLLFETDRTVAARMWNTRQREGAPAFDAETVVRASAARPPRVPPAERGPRS